MGSFCVLVCLSFVLIVQALDVKTAAKQHTQTDFILTLPPECVGQELCMEKPIDYPTEEIDRVAKRLARRLRRNSPSGQEPATPVQGDRNNCVETRKESTPFLYLANITQTFPIIQSEFFKQVITTVSCRSEGASCFGFLDAQGYSGRRYCETKYSAVYFMAYNVNEKRVDHIATRIPVGCSCMTEPMSD